LAVWPFDVRLVSPSGVTMVSQLSAIGDGIAAGVGAAEVEVEEVGATPGPADAQDVSTVRQNTTAAPARRFLVIWGLRFS
jgi:hypothetical protein